MGFRSGEDMILKLVVEVEYDAHGVQRGELFKRLLDMVDPQVHEKKLIGSTKAWIRSTKSKVVLVDPGKSACCPPGTTLAPDLRVKRRKRRSCVGCKKRRKVCKTSGLCVQTCCHGPHWDSEIH